MAVRAVGDRTVAAIGLQIDRMRAATSRGHDHTQATLAWAEADRQTTAAQATAAPRRRPRRQ
ncbi:unnamed protein product [Musa textilis]